MKTAQELADRLAELAGWKYDSAGFGVRQGDRDHQGHPFPIGSLDALEAFRREQLEGWVWYRIDTMGDGGKWRCFMARRQPAKIINSPTELPDEWAARAAALIAAKESTTAPLGAPPQPRETKK